MSGNGVQTIVEFVVKEGRGDDFVALLTQLRDPTRAEPGCRAYDLLRSTDDPTRFLCVEEWVDEAAIEAHRQSPHVAAAGQALRDILAKPLAVRRFAAAW
jgi:autoinducer 2-degrading protein